MEFLSNNLMLLAISVLLAYVLLRVPVIGKYLSIVNTLFHEVGHAIFALLTFGKIDKIELFSNTEGTAWTSSRFWIGRVLTSFAGYPSASAIAVLFLYLISVDNYLYVFIIISVVVIFSLIFWIRNIYGSLWALSSIFLLYSLVRYGNEDLIKIVLILITSIILVESVRSAWQILMLSFKTPMDAGDTTNLWKSILIIPPQLWGIVFFVQSVFFAYLGIKIFIY